MSCKASKLVENLGLNPDEYKFSIIFTANEINQLMLSNPEMAPLVWDIKNVAPAFQQHTDMVDMLVPIMANLDYWYWHSHYRYRNLVPVLSFLGSVSDTVQNFYGPQSGNLPVLVLSHTCSGIDTVPFWYRHITMS
jgi:hypothetical protein